ncbi:MAG: hypothetical protein V9G23_13760 [Giesbergeria sp.]
MADAPSRVHRGEGRSGLVKQLVPMRDEQDACRVAGIERREEGLAEAGRGDDQRPAMSVGAQSLQFAQRELLRRSGLHGRPLGRNGLGEQPGRAARAIGVDPSGRQRVDVGAVPEFVEARPQLVQRLAGVEVQHRPGPLDAVTQTHAGEVRRADERAARAVRAFEQVGLGVEAATLVAPDAGLEPTLEPAQDIERVGLGHVEVVGGEQANVGATQQCRAQRAVEQGDTAAHHEGDRETGRRASLKLGLDRIEQRRRAADVQARATDPGVAQHQAGVEAAARRMLGAQRCVDLHSGQAIACGDRVDHGLQVRELAEQLGAATVEDGVERLVRLLDELQAEQAVELVLARRARLQRTAVLPRPARGCRRGSASRARQPASRSRADQ